jgi:RsiW-degrading membrane proteinase PrsW (M82 family)
MAIFAAFFLSFIPALIYVMMVYWLDRYEKEPKILVGGVFLWGAIIAAGAAYVLNTVMGIGIYALTADEVLTDIATGSLVAPLTEEVLKGFAVLIVFLVFYKEFDSVLDGIIYAGVTALGFAATENVLYLYERGFLEDGWEGLWFLFFLRVIFGAWNHASYTAFTGIGLAITRLSKSCLVKTLAPVGGLLIAMFVHFLHNTLSVFVEGVGGLVFVFIVDWLGWLFIIIIILWATSREKKWIKIHLQEEVANGLLTPGQFKVASSAWNRGMAKLNALFSGGYWDTRKFYQLCTELAYKKYQYTQVGETRGNTQEMIEKLRGEVGRLSSRAKI